MDWDAKHALVEITNVREKMTMGNQLSVLLGLQVAFMPTIMELTKEVIHLIPFEVLKVTIVLLSEDLIIRACSSIDVGCSSLEPVIFAP